MAFSTAQRMQTVRARFYASIFTSAFIGATRADELPIGLDDRVLTVLVVKIANEAAHKFIEQAKSCPKYVQPERCSPETRRKISDGNKAYAARTAQERTCQT